MKIHHNPYPGWGFIYFSEIAWINFLYFWIV